LESKTVPPSDSGQRAGEFIQAGYRVLEQVADTPGCGREQLDRLVDLGVGRQQQDADGRELIADLKCGADALRGVGRRHADVDDRHVGLVLLDGAQQQRRVAGLREDLYAGPPEQISERLAEQGPVVGQDHPQRHGAATSRWLGHVLILARRRPGVTAG
jgi:hypothetical protein